VESFFPDVYDDVSRGDVDEARDRPPLVLDPEEDVVLLEVPLVGPSNFLCASNR